MQAPGPQVDDAEPGGQTPLMLACIKGQLDLVKQLLSLGARVNPAGLDTVALRRQRRHRRTALAIAQLLLDTPTVSTPRISRKTAHTMIRWRRNMAHKPWFSCLLDAGADVQARNELGLTRSGLRAPFGPRLYGARILRSRLTTPPAAPRPAGNWCSMNS